MPFKEILGQDHAINLIKNYISRGRTPQSWLFIGQKNIGKFKTAVAVAQKLNCKNSGDDACGVCDYCIQIAGQNFLDFLVLIPEGKNIKINQIRKSLDWLHLHPDQAKIRVMIIDGANYLGREAANAFLKTLEEPAPNTLLILIAESSQQLQETIVSRCQQIRFRPLSEEISRQILQLTTNLTNERIHLLCNLSMGSINTHLASKIEIIESVQSEAINWLTNISSKNLEDILKTCDTWSKSKNEEIFLFLDFLEFWFRDLFFILNGLTEEKMINKFFGPSGGRITLIKKCSMNFGIENVQEIYWRINNLRRSIELNANKLLAIESLCLYIHKISL